jgi:hypothetical protein
MYCSLDAAKKLEQLGIVQKADFYWVKINNSGNDELDYWILPVAHHTKFVRLDLQGVIYPDNAAMWINDSKESHPAYDYEKYAAYSVGELGLMLPPNISTSANHNNKWTLWDFMDDWSWQVVESATEAEARAAFITKQLEQGVETPASINQRYEARP